MSQENPTCMCSQMARHHIKVSFTSLDSTIKISNDFFSSSKILQFREKDIPAASISRPLANEQLQNIKHNSNIVSLARLSLHVHNNKQQQQKHTTKTNRAEESSVKCLRCFFWLACHMILVAFCRSNKEQKIKSLESHVHLHRHGIL